MKNRLIPFLLFLLTSFAVPAEQAQDVRLQLALRTRVQTEGGNWKEAIRLGELDPKATAIIICDMWDKHWCKSATERCDQLAKGIAPLVEEARSRGIFIIHAPSDTMNFYEETPQRKRMKEAAKSEPPRPIRRWCTLDPGKESTLPIDDSDGGCDDLPQCKNYKAWTRQHAGIRVAEEDGVTDRGEEVYSVLHQKGITNILFVGVHANMCVLGRSFAIRQMTELGFNCVLVRDLTDSMYNLRKSPYVNHEQGTALVVEHIEKYWCPTTLSEELRFAPAGIHF